MDKTESHIQTSMFSNGHQKHKLKLEKYHSTNTWNYEKQITLRSLLSDTESSLQDNMHYLMYNQEVKWMFLIFQYIKLFNIQNVHFVDTNLNLQKLFRRVIPKKIEKLTNFIEVNEAFTTLLANYIPQNVFTSFMLRVLRSVNTHDTFSNLDHVISFSTENMIEFFLYYIYYLCNKVYKNNTLQVNYVFPDPGISWLCLAVNQNYSYLEIINNEVDIASPTDDCDNNYINYTDEHLATFLSNGYSTAVKEELVKDLQLRADNILTPLWIYNPIHIKEVVNSKTIVHELPINWYVLPTPMYCSLEAINDSLPLIRLSYLLKSVLQGYLFKSQNIWMLDVKRNQVCPKNEFHSLPYNYITSMYLLSLNNNIGDIFVDTKIKCSKSDVHRIIFALLCHCNISDKLLHFLQSNIAEWIDYFPFLDNSFLFDGSFNKIYTGSDLEKDQYVITLDDQAFSVNKTLTFNLFYYKRNVQNNKFFIVLLCVHRYTECGLWMYQQLLKSGRKENKHLAEAQLPLMNKNQISWLPLDCETEPMKIEVFIDLIQPVIEKGQYIIDQVYQAFENGKFKCE